MINLSKYWNQFVAWDRAEGYAMTIMFCVLTIVGITVVRMLFRDVVRRSYARQEKKYKWSTGFMVLFTSIFWYITLIIIGITALLNTLYKGFKIFKAGQPPPDWW